MSKTFSRRSFLRGAAAGAASLAAMTVLGTEKSSAEAAALYTPGTYTATAQGIGTVTMTATFDEASIVSIDLDVSGETEDYGQAAKDELIQQIMDAQSAEIDGVSGATVTSNAVKECLTSCIAQAKGIDVSMLTAA